MGRNKHSKKEVEAALRYAESQGWTVTDNSSKRGHKWGDMRCPNNSKDCRCGMYCLSSIWSTPKNEGNHAKQIRRKVDGCTKKEKEK